MAVRKTTIKLEGECTIYEVAQKHQQILQNWSDQSQPLTIDLSKVTEIDSCFIQMLISCKKTAEQKQIDCSLIKPPVEVEQRFNTIDAGKFLSQ